MYVLELLFEEKAIILVWKIYIILSNIRIYISYNVSTCLLFDTLDKQDQEAECCGEK